MKNVYHEEIKRISEKKEKKSLCKKIQKGLDGDYTIISYELPLMFYALFHKTGDKYAALRELNIEPCIIETDSDHVIF